MLEDAVVLNMGSVRDGDRLTLIPTNSLTQYLTARQSKVVP